MRETAGLTQQELAARAGWSVGTISDLENHGRGGVRLKRKVREVLAPLLKNSAPEKYPSLESEKNRVVAGEEMADNLTAEQWKQRAIAAEQESERLRAAVHVLAAPLSSGPLSEAQQIAKRAGEQFDRDHPKS